MIIQHPDGSYEFRCMPTAASLWLRTLGRRLRTRVMRAVRLATRPEPAVCSDRSVCTAASGGGR